MGVDEILISMPNTKSVSFFYLSYIVGFNQINIAHIWKYNTNRKTMKEIDKYINSQEKKERSTNIWVIGN